MLYDAVPVKCQYSSLVVICAGQNVEGMITNLMLHQVVI